MSNEDLKRHSMILNLYRNRMKLEKRGAEYTGKCPFHSESTGSFTLSQSEGKWLFKCFGGGCDAAGDIFSFIQRIDSCKFNKAKEIIEEFCGVKDKEIATEHFSETVIADKPKKTLTLEEYKKNEDALEKNTFVQNWLLHERGIGMDAARKLHFGYVQDLTKLQDSTIADIVNKGWLTFPVIEENKVVAIEFRSIMRKEVRKMPGMKNTGLLGGHLVDPLNPAFVCEGPFDCATLVQAGYTACSIPNAQFNPTPEAVELLKQAEYVILAGDTDAPGQAAMQKLFKSLQTNVYQISWSASKDANQSFLSQPGREVSGFKAMVDQLVENARQNPLKGIYSVQHSLLNAEHGQLIEHPDRLRFPWKTMDEMAIIMPGTVTVVYSTDAGMGKSSLVFQATIHQAQKCGEVVLNYQAELMPQQIDTFFASHLLHKDRLTLETEDYKKAGRVLGQDFRYYIGRDTSLTTVDQVLDLIESGVKHFHPTVVVLDNLGFVCRGSGSDVYRNQAAAMQRITQMSGTYNLKFIVVHQARKADQQHKGKTNHVSDLDGTKAIQNDASTIFSLHREEIKQDKNAVEASENEYSPICEISAKKFRDKGPGKSFTRLVFAGKICRFTEVSQESPFQGETKDNLF